MKSESGFRVPMATQPFWNPKADITESESFLEQRLNHLNQLSFPEVLPDEGCEFLPDTWLDQPYNGQDEAGECTRHGHDEAQDDGQVEGGALPLLLHPRPNCLCEHRVCLAHLLESRYLEGPGVVLQGDESTESVESFWRVAQRMFSRGVTSETCCKNSSWWIW